jgi:hypothetical protein
MKEALKRVKLKQYAKYYPERTCFRKVSQQIKSWVAQTETLPSLPTML